MNHRFRTYEAAAWPAVRVACGAGRLCPCADSTNISRRRPEGTCPPAPAARSFFSLKLSLLIFFIFAVIHPSILCAVPAGTIITNTATAAYLDNGSAAAVVSSNISTITTVELRTPSTLEVFQYAPASPAAVPQDIRPADYSTSGTAAGPFVSLPAPTAPDGSPINIAAPVPLVPAVQYHITEPIFIRVTDPDQNLDPLVSETVLVTVGIGAGETEVVRLAETGLDTGVFSGCLPTGPLPVLSGSGVLNAQSNDTILFSYTDAADGTDTRTGSVLVDPFGLVINSLTGQPVNGANIMIIDAGTGQPATVFGDDGISAFPATVTSGGSAVDSAGTAYSFPPGGYRFPFVLPGNYRYRITAPANFRAPSTVPTATLQALPGGPFAIVPGSREEIFTVNPGPALHIDIPVDPTGNRLYVRKTAGRATISAGDHVPYRVTVENVDAASPVTTVVVKDRLPYGFRYKGGTARIDGAPASDPDISGDGRTLSFPLGTVAAGRSVSIDYIAAAGAGARPGKATNSAIAAGDLNAVSNTATATVQVREDLFREKSTIIGRLLVDGCGDPEKAEVSGIKGVRVFLEDGAFTVTDNKGMFHFAEIRPGTHVIRLDQETIPAKYEVLTCEENTRSAGAAHSRFVDIQGGMLWQTDFHLGLRPKLRGSAGITLSSAARSAAVKTAKRSRLNLLDYDVVVDADTVPLRNARISIMLPGNLSYVPGSSLFETPIADPEIYDNTLTYRLDELVSGRTGTIWFTTTVTPPPGLVPFTTRAVLTADTPDAKNVRTPVAETRRELIVLSEKQAAPDIMLRPRFASGSSVLTRKDRRTLRGIIKRLKKLDIAYIRITGHTDSIPFRSRYARFKDNYELAGARAESVAEYIRKALKLDRNQVETVSRGPDDPIASNGTVRGRALNRRVELQVFSIRVVSWAEVKRGKKTSERKSVETVGLRPGEVWPREDRAASGKTRLQSNPGEYTAAWMETLQPGFELLLPEPGHHPAIPAVTIAVKHSRADSISVQLNGEDVDPLYFDGVIKRSDGLTVSIWRGLHLRDGDNTIEVRANDADGVTSGRIRRSIHYSTPPVKAAIVPERSLLTADGRAAPVIALRLTDKDGHPARMGIVGEYSVDPPHAPRRTEEELRNLPDAASGVRLRYKVGADSIVLIELEPTIVTGEAVIRLGLAEGMQEIRPWLKPGDRDWILVGLAEGTAGYNAVSGNMESVSAAGEEDNLYHDGRVSFYAKGRIKGEWLLTLAYDSAKKENRERLYQSIDPNKYYLLYGDSAEQRHEAPSSGKIYIKLDRDQFSALFGDYSAGLTITELSRYNRNLNGFKSEYRSGRFDLTAFASDTNQAFVKDELPGDGTSGLYRLSRRRIVMNSESVIIETRDRFRSEVIVNRQPLARWIDYTIDYEKGTIFFKAPVPGRDAQFNPVFIVVDYESSDSSDLSWNYGGRAAVRTAGENVEVGATYVHEGRIGGKGRLSGLDAKIAVDEQTSIRAEVAGTDTEAGTTSTEGTAYLAEIIHRSPKIQGKAYVREQEQGFGLGQQSGSETGTRKMGLDALYHIDASTALRGETFRQYNLSTGAVRDVAQIQGMYSTNLYETGAGFRFAEDDYVTGDPRTSEQVFVTGKFRLTGKTTVSLSRDQSLPGCDDNADYPSRTTMGVEYRVSSAATLFGAQELTSSSTGETAASRVGFRALPWTGSAVRSSIENQQTESGTRLFSVSGLKQSWIVTPKWTLDASLDRSASIKQKNEPSFNTNVPPASGAEDFTAVSIGAGYKEKKWSWNGRVEKRTAVSEDKRGLFAGASGEVRPGLGLVGSYQAFRTESSAGVKRTAADLRLGLAYRPDGSRWIVLDRLDYITEEQEDSQARYDNWRVVNNLAANVRWSDRTQVGFQYGARYVNETIESGEYRGYTHLPGLEIRYDITKSWDIGIRGSLLHSLETNQLDYAAGLSTGHTVARNLWLSIGYNVTGFRDPDFSRADFTSAGPFFKIRMKFDRSTAAEAIRWVTGR